MAPSSADNASIVSGFTTGTGRVPYSRTTFTLDTFSSADFIVKDFVEALSESAAPATRKSIQAQSNTANTQAFDPKPLIRTFEQALTRLKTLSEDLELRENELSANVRRVESQHNQNIRARERDLEQAVDSFNGLERSLDGGEAGGNAAVRIGERLEELDKQRQRAQDAKFILQCWIEVSGRGDLSSLEDVRRLGGSEGKVRCAYIAKQLLKISQRMDIQTNGRQANGVNGANGYSDGKPTPKEVIEKFLEGLEKDLLKQFDDFYRRQNFDGMRECSAALRDFGDGASVMGLFVNQHQFFIDRSQLVTEDVSSDPELWERMADPDAEPPGVEPTLQSLIDEVRLVAQEESFIMKRAFPFYEEVLGRFLQRVFQQSIQQKLEMVLDQASDVSALAFLRALQSSKTYITTMVEDLKTHGLTEHPEPASAQTAAILDQQLDDLFVPYSMGSSYIDREKRSLEELYSSLLFKFTTYHSRRKRAGPTSYLGSLQARSKELMSSARDKYLERLHSTDIPASQKAVLARIAGIRETARGNEIEVTDADGDLSLPYTKRMLKWLAEGIGRGLELAGGHETPKDVREMLTLLVSNLGEIYLETALEAAIDIAASQETSKTGPDLSYVADMRSSISILHLLVVTIQTLLMPLVASNLTIRRDLEKSTNLLVDRMESKIDTILQKTLDSAMAWTSRILSQQKKTDFRPRDDAQLQLDQLQTPTCLSIFTFLNKLYINASSSLSGRVLEGFALELGLGLRTLLLVHFKSYQVNLAGGLVVSRDMTKYIELMRIFKLPDTFDPSLEVLTEIANLFVIGPEALKDRLRGVGSQALAGIEKNDLRPYVLRREDANSVAVQSALSSL